ncbi:MAG: hypothetical protein WCJ62_13040, partial [Flavobacterium sp.]
PIGIYSLVNDRKFNIQGRALPFDNYDLVPLGINLTTTGNFSIAIAAVDGLFENHIIYLIDSQLNIIHNLKETPYNFTSRNGMYNNRFKIVYRNDYLSNSELDFNNEVQVIENSSVMIKSTTKKIKSVNVYDVVGRKIANYNSVDANEISLKEIKKNDEVLLLQITLEDNIETNKKIIF